MQAGARIGTNALSQGATQAVQSVVSDLLTQAILGGKSGVDWEEALYQGVLGAITGGGFAIAQEAGKGVGNTLDAEEGKLGKWNAKSIAKKARQLDPYGKPSGVVEGAGKDIVGTNHNEINPTQEVVNPKKVDEYIKRLQAGEKLAPIEVIEVPGKGKYIIEGHHRYIASLKAGIPIDIRTIKDVGPIGMPNWSNVNWKEYINESQFWGD